MRIWRQNISRNTARIGDEAKNLLHLTMSELEMSARAYHRILKIARTIADLADSENIQTE